jgi:hypothetical protein
MWVSYRPCLRPDSDRTWVHVIYFRTETGNWKSIYWSWSLVRPGVYRTVSDEQGNVPSH